MFGGRRRSDLEMTWLRCCTGAATASKTTGRLSDQPWRPCIPSRCYCGFSRVENENILVPSAITTCKSTSLSVMHLNSSILDTCITHDYSATASSTQWLQYSWYMYIFNKNNSFTWNFVTVRSTQFPRQTRCRSSVVHWHRSTTHQLV